MAKDLLFEIGTEEMPAGFINRVREDYKNLVEEELNNNRLEFENIQVYSTPRRLTLYVENLADNQNTKKEIVRGPSEKIAFDEEKNLTRAGQGFARGQGVERDDLIIKDGYLYVEKIEEGKKTSEILNLFLPELLKKIPFPKTMQWGNYKFKFIRPIKWLLALFGEKLIKFNLTGVDSDNNG